MLLAEGSMEGLGIEGLRVLMCFVVYVYFKEYRHAYMHVVSVLGVLRFCPCDPQKKVLECLPQTNLMCVASLGFRVQGLGFFKKTAVF